LAGYETINTALFGTDSIVGSRMGQLTCQQTYLVHDDHGIILHPNRVTEWGMLLPETT